MIRIMTPRLRIVHLFDAPQVGEPNGETVQIAPALVQNCGADPLVFGMNISRHEFQLDVGILADLAIAGPPDKMRRKAIALHDALRNSCSKQFNMFPPSISFWPLYAPSSPSDTYIKDSGKAIIM